MNFKISATFMKRKLVVLLSLLLCGLTMRGQISPSDPAIDTYHYYRMNMACNSGPSYQSGYNITTPTGTSPFVHVAEASDNYTIWYFVLAESGSPDYYYFINAETGQYLYYTGDGIVGEDNNVFQMESYSESDADRYQFAMRATGNTATTTYTFYPKAIIEGDATNDETQMYVVGNNEDTDNLGINACTSWTLIKSAQWNFISVSGFCPNPVITNNFDGTISMSCPVVGANIYYTTDGSTPSSSSMLYSGSFDLGADVTEIKAIAYDGSFASDIVTYTVPTCATPVFSFDYTTAAVTMTSEGTIYYTTDGTTPSSASSEYTAPIIITEPAVGEAVTVKAFATRLGYHDSEVSTQDYGKLAEPAISIESGSGEVTITYPTGSTVYYTLNGSTPSPGASGSITYTGSFVLNGPATVKAVAYQENFFPSALSEENFARVAMPAITFDYVSSLVTITCTDTEGVSIYYTTDGRTPSPSSTYSTEYTVPFSITMATTVKAIAVKSGSVPSLIAKKIISQVATPTIQDGGDNTIVITCATEDAAIYYTTNGDTPTSSSTLYTEPIGETGSGQTIKAIALKSDMVTSAIGSGMVQLTCAPPVIIRTGINTFTIASGGFPSSETTIKYTTNGNDPASGSTYNSEVTVSTFPTTVRAIVTKTGFNDSSESTMVINEGLSGDGSLATPYLIANEGDFGLFVYKVQTGGEADKCFRLIVDVNAAGSIPISTVFTGTFEAIADGEGNYYSISNLSHPLFNTISGGTVRNVVLKEVSISSGNGNGDAGAIAHEANGASRIYNCGILSGSVGGTRYVGGLVGFLDGTSRVINCYSFADITGGSHKGGIVGYNNYASKSGDIKTMVMNCMFYGDIAASGNISPIYGGNEIKNEDTEKLNNYNYYRYNSPYSQSKKITKYNRALPTEDRYLVRFEFYRYLLNSTRELAGWYATGTASKASIAKWVLDKSIAPYPILKEQGIYSSVVNYDAAHAEDGKPRLQGGKLGTLTVTISGVGSNAPAGAAITNGSLTLVRTDKDTANFNFNYDKVQLPYYREVGTGNYTNNKVVTGWKITGMSGGSQGTFTTGEDAPAYNFADRSTYAKDLYSESGRVFSQGAYFDVPDGVTSITIEPYWGKAAYLSDAQYDCYGYNTSQGVNDFGTRYTNGNNYEINGDSQKVYTSFSNALNNLSGVSDPTVYDYAVVLVGNYHQKGAPSNGTKPFTIMSADLDEDNEPDYSFIYNSGKGEKISPIRFDFVNVPGTAMAHKKTSTTYMGIMGNHKWRGWLEVTNTAFIRFSQLEYDDKSTKAANSPVILLGGVVEQMVSTNGANEPLTSTSYIHVGSNVWFKLFNNGCHIDKTAVSTPRIPISVTGGDYEKFYLSGYFQPNAPSNTNDNAECYISGGRFKELAGSGQEKIDGDVWWLIDRADITNFYGGGINDKKPVTGNIDVTIKNSYVELYCGGPKFGDMTSGKTVTTTANNCTFRRYYGAGYGGTSVVRVSTYNKFDKINYDWNSSIVTTFISGDNRRGKYSNSNGISISYEYEHFEGSNDKSVGRFYVNYASLSLAQTNDVISNLTNCTILEDFYGGGNLGKVSGDITSTLNSCLVHGSVYGAGYSASAPTATVFNAAGFTIQPNYNTSTGMFEPGVFPSSQTYTWTSGYGCSTSNTLVDNGNEHWIYAPEETLNNLGKVEGNVTLNLLGDTHVDGFVDDGQGGEVQSGGVYGGGEMGAVAGSTQVVIGDINVSVNPEVYNVFGAGKGVVQEIPTAMANADVSISTTVTFNKGRVKGSVYGGGENGSVGIAGSGAVSTVHINGGRVNGDVFGGGNMGFTQGNTIVNLNGDAIVDYNLFGGAYGEVGKVFVAGLRTVNMCGGTVYGNVYAGSRNADDATEFNPGDFDSHDGSGTACVLNMSGGHAANNVFGAGFFGNTFGSAYIFIGTNAIMNAPNHTAGLAPYNAAYYNEHKALIVNLDIWAGADYGVLSSTDEFNPPTISGRSDIYLDGAGYDTQNPGKQDETFMLIGKSIFGCGTSCDAGKRGRRIMIRNYGHAMENPNYSPSDRGAIEEPYLTATRGLFSLQRADSLIIESSHIHLVGQGVVTSVDATETYSIYGLEGVRVVNGSSLFIDEPIEEIQKLGSYTCADVYAAIPSYTIVNYDDLTTSGMDNKIRVNNGTFVNVGYFDYEWWLYWFYGELQGFFYMMTDGRNNAYAYARMKNSTEPGNGVFSLDNPDDGGFVSYHDEFNVYDETGGIAADGVQMRYVNSAPDSKENWIYYRVWSYDNDIYSNREGVLNAVLDKNNLGGFSTVDVRIDLPAAKGRHGYYYRIKTVADQPFIDYGTEIMTVNAALYQTMDDPPEKYWMYYKSETPSGNVYELDGSEEFLANGKNAMMNLPNNVFGLTAIPEGCFFSIGDHPEPWILCGDADEFFVDEDTKWTLYPDVLGEMPFVRFMLTYYNGLTVNAEWEPITITMVQCDPSDNIVEEVEIRLTITTTTAIDQEVVINTYGMYPSGTGNQDETFEAKVMLPSYPLATTGTFSDWTLQQIEWKPKTSPDFDNALVTGTSYHDSNNKVGMTLQPSFNFDNINGWGNDPSEIVPVDLGAVQTVSGVNPLEDASYDLGHADGRNPISFDFTLKYDGTQEGVAVDKDTLGCAELTIRFTNYALSEEEDMHQDVLFKVYVMRRGQRHKFYLDGVNGSSAYSGIYPNAPKKTLASILMFGGEQEYTPGDSIFIVNTVTVDNSSGRVWNGSEYGRLELYRYPGGHSLASSGSYYTGYDAVNNPAFRGPLVEVETGMTLSAVTLDGSYGLKDKTVGAPADHVLADEPLIEVKEGGTLTLLGGTELVNNHNQSTDGGAISMENGSTLYMNDGSTITGNTVVIGKNGGGIFSDESSIILSDMVTINGNKQADADNNIYLNTFNSVINIGTIAPLDAYGPLDAAARVGVTKTAWDASLFYMPVLYAEDGEHLSNLLSGTIVFNEHDAYMLQQLPLIDAEHHLYYLNSEPWTNIVTAEPSGFDPLQDPIELNNEEQLAWAISYVNGLNGSDPHLSANFVLNADLNMGSYIWVPIGTKKDETEMPYSGTFNGNGHHVKGVSIPYCEGDAGFFGKTHNANISNLTVSANFYGKCTNMGLLIGQMTAGQITCSGASGTLATTETEASNMGGLVGLAEMDGPTRPFMHSVYSGSTLNPQLMTTVGGLVGNNGGVIYNAYSNSRIYNTYSSAGGLTGNNSGTLENCYVNIGNQTYPVFAASNTGTIQYCYGNSSNYLGSGTVTGHGQFTTTAERKNIDYMYRDNIVTLASGETSSYVANEVSYLSNHAVVWLGLLSAMNQWVREKNAILDPSSPYYNKAFASWFRPTTKNINGDLPVLSLPMANCLAVADDDGRFLEYNPSLDDLLDAYNSLNENATIFHYGEATDVANVPTDKVKVFINEDAVLMQSDLSTKDFNVTVGVTFDNSCGAANDYFGNQLYYDWHLMSSSLQDAPLGIVYSDNEEHTDTNTNQVADVVNSYLPDDIDNKTAYPDAKWDIYAYYEPEYHWINLKRNGKSHHHTDGDHSQIAYKATPDAEPLKNESVFVPGKGYMMAINDNTYLSNTGKLNRGDVTIKLTCQEPSYLEYAKGSNLIGNPYQAYLDLDAFFGGTGFNAAYIYDADIGVGSGDDRVQGVYAVYTTDASINPVLPSRYIHPHQGFFVITSTDKQITITPSMAGTNKDGESYLRAGGRPAYPLVNLFAEDPNGNFDLAVVEFERPETGGALKENAFRNADCQVFAHSDDKDYAILFAKQGTARIPVWFNVNTEGNYTLRWETHNGIFNSLHLIDNLSGTDCDMLANDRYTFSASPDDYKARFYITYSCIGIEEDIIETDESFVFFDGSSWCVEGQGQLELVDVTGRILYAERLTNEMNHISLPPVAKGVYVMRLWNKDTARIQKIVIQ